MTPTEALAVRLTELLGDRVNREVQAEDVHCPRGGERVAQHRAGAACWNAWVPAGNTNLLVYSYETVTRCARVGRERLQLDWEDYLTAEAWVQ